MVEVCSCNPKPGPDTALERFLACEPENIPPETRISLHSRQERSPGHASGNRPGPRAFAFILVRLKESHRVHGKPVLPEPFNVLFVEVAGPEAFQFRLFPVGGLVLAEPLPRPRAGGRLPVAAVVPLRLVLRGVAGRTTTGEVFVGSAGGMPLASGDGVAASASAAGFRFPFEPFRPRFRPDRALPSLPPVPSVLRVPSESECPTGSADPSACFPDPPRVWPKYGRSPPPWVASEGVSLC